MLGTHGPLSTLHELQALSRTKTQTEPTEEIYAPKPWVPPGFSRKETQIIFCGIHQLEEIITL